MIFSAANRRSSHEDLFERSNVGMKQAADSDLVMTPDDVAELLQIKPRQLERFGIPACRLGHKTVRYLRADVLAWLEQQRKTA